MKYRLQIQRKFHEIYDLDDIDDDTLFCQRLLRESGYYNKVENFKSKKNAKNYFYKYIRHIYGYKYYHKCLMNNMKDRIRTTTRHAFKRLKLNKPAKTEKLLGAPWHIVKKHIESKFTDELNWSNFSEWHIDHIKPLAMAKNMDELVKLAHYTNLQPLFAKDNHRKNSNYKGTSYRTKK